VYKSPVRSGFPPPKRATATATGSTFAQFWGTGNRNHPEPAGPATVGSVAVCQPVVTGFLKTGCNQLKTGHNRYFLLNLFTFTYN